MSKNISQMIVEVCEQLKIDYHSCNPHFHQFKNDAVTLVDLYVELKEIMVKLLEIEERHNVKGLADLIQIDIDQLSKIDHDLIKFAKKINEEGKNVK
jgi:hypothetical protein